MVIAKVWEIFQIRQVNDLFLGKGIGLADKDMRLGCKEVGSNQMIIIQHLREHISVVAIQKEHANLASEILDVIDDLPSPCLPEEKLIFFHVTFLKERDKGLNHEGVVL